MNVALLLKEYFDNLPSVSIDVFDADSINDVYSDVIKVLTSHFNIEVSVLQAINYCFYEVLDNVLMHSGRPLGTVLTNYNQAENVLRILVADDGMGIRASLAENAKYEAISEAEALSVCLNDSVTDGKGMGFGLFATSRLMKTIGINFIIHSGHHKLVFENGQVSVKSNGLWTGTIVYLEVRTNKAIDPDDVVDHRTDVTNQYNEYFVESDEIEQLW